VHDGLVVDTFTSRMLRGVGIVSAAAVALYLVAVGIDVLLLAFAGVLLALVLRGAALWVARVTHLGVGAALGAVVVLVAVLVGLVGWWIAPAVVEQTAQLVERVPEAVTHLRDSLARTAWGRAIAPYLPSVPALNPLARPFRAGSTLLATLGWLAGGVAGVALVAFIGLYLAAAPEVYRRGLLHLVPAPRRARTEAILGTLAGTLQWWLVGKVISMALIGSLTGVGLALLGIPLALALGVVAGLLNFIPYLGPLLSFVPAALLSLSQGLESLVWVLGLYVLVQAVESYVVTPLVQQQAVALPPAMVITAQVLLGVALGCLGLLLATPITAAVVVLVRELYIAEGRAAAPGRRCVGQIV
jgi:predicted PurR-regulated permease PerM